MAVSFWLPKVIVVLTFCGISCAFDDLLNRIRISKGNEPEVTDFLKAVLKHHNDFKWIQEAADIQNPYEHVLPLRGLPLKSKRSFYSSRNGYPIYRSYGYRMPHPYSFERPTNDVYPYEEENESQFDLRNSERAYGDAVNAGRDSHTNYDDKSRYDDFFEKPDDDIASFVAEDEPDGERIKRDAGGFDFTDELHQTRHDDNNINSDVEKLLNEKIVLHDILSKNKHTNWKIVKDPERSNPSSKSNSDQIEVFPNSENGYLYAPGSKYEYKTDDHKRCVESNADHEILLFGEMTNKTNASVESPLGEFYYSGPHDILGITQDQQLEQHQSHGNNNETCSKFKKSERQKRAIHLDDFLSHPGRRSRKQEKSIKIKIFDDGRLVKDIKKGEANSIVLTIKNERSNVFKTTERTPIFLNSGDKTFHNWNSYLPSYMPSLHDDNTLEKIDTMIQRDQASLKLSSQLPFSQKIRKESYPLNDMLRDQGLLGLYNEAFNGNTTTTIKRKSINTHHDKQSDKRDKLFPTIHMNHASDQKPQRKLSYERVNEMGIRLDTRNFDTNPLIHSDIEGSYEYNQNPSSKFQMSNSFIIDGKHDTIPKITNDFLVPQKINLKYTNDLGTPETFVKSVDTTTVSGEAQNRLEDQSEPTSASEQRELGKINNTFSTPALDIMSTDKMLIIPFKKSVDTDGDDSRPNTFRVKDSRDMIHTGGVKFKKSQDSTSQYSNILIHNSLKSANEVLEKLKTDLDKTVTKGEPPKDKFKIGFNEETFYEGFDDLDANNEDDSRKGSDDEYDIKGVPDDNIELPTVSSYVPAVNAKSKSTNKIQLEDDAEIRNSRDGRTKNENIEIYTFRTRGLKSLEVHSKIIPENNLLKNKRSLTDIFGMTNDQDYSEDKIDYYDGEFKRSGTTYKLKKPVRKTFVKKNNHKSVSAIKGNSQVKRKHPEKTNVNIEMRSMPKKRKMKKDVSMEFSEPPDNKKVNIFTENMDLIQKRENRLHHKNSYDDDSRPEINVNDNGNRTNDMKEESTPIEEIQPQAIKISSGGNELDIIEKTQAILLHVTDPPAIENSEPTETTIAHGEIDENDDANTKVEEHRSNNNTFNIKHTSILKVTNAEKNDDIVGEIMKLVRNYKNNQMNRQGSLKKSKQHEERFHRYPDEYDDEEEASFAHHQQNNKKKIHPKSSELNTCKIKPGTDHNYKEYHPKHSQIDIQYPEPRAAKEGYMEIETMLNNKKKQSDAESDRDINENNYLSDAVDKKDNPMRFTPDNVEYFKSIIESPRYERSLTNTDDKFYDNIETSDPEEGRKFRNYIDSLDENYRAAVQRNTRSLNDNEDDELDKMISPVQMPEDVDDNVRIRRFKNYNYNPYYYEPLSNVRQQYAQVTPVGAAHVQRQPASGGARDVTTETIKPSDSSKRRKSVGIHVPKVTEREHETYSEVTTVTSSIVQSGYPLSTTTNKCSTTHATLTTTDNCTTTKSGAHDKECLSEDEYDSHIHHKNKNVVSKVTKQNKNKHGGKLKTDKHPYVTYDDTKHKNNKYVKGETERERKLKEKNRMKISNFQEDDHRKEHDHFKNILNGHLVLDIIDNFQTRLKENENLSSRFGQALGKKCAADQVAQIDTFREEQSKKDIKHAQLMLHQVIVMMNKIVADQVHRRTCVVLPPTVREFLKKLTTVRQGTTKSLQVAEGYPLPQISDHNKHPSPVNSEEGQGDFLFNNPENIAHADSPGSNRELMVKKKIVLIKKLLNKYDHMTEHCQIKVQPVKDYLLKHLEMLDKMSKDSEFKDEDFCPIPPEYLKKCQNVTVNTTDAHGEAASASHTGFNSTENAVTTSSTHQETIHTTIPIVSLSVSSAPAERGAGKAVSQDPYHNFYNKQFSRYDRGHSKILSDRYRKLAEAADSYRRKREIEKRLGRLFGRHKRLPTADTEDNTKPTKQLNDIAFESPLIFSLDD